jgi:hypothetical protein
MPQVSTQEFERLPLRVHTFLAGVLLYGAHSFAASSLFCCVLTLELLSDIMSDMKITTRSLVREFRRIKAAARKGQKVEIYDGRTGEAFFLTAKPKKTFGELAEMAKGVYSGPTNLSSREGFDA